MDGRPRPAMKISPPAEKALFAEALECASPEARAAYLQAACGGDAALRGRLEALLHAADQAEGFLEAPPPDLDGAADAEDSPAGPGAASGATDSLRILPGDLAPSCEREGTVIGRYRLLEKIGEGGCGIVYLAEQAEPVRRRVALKILKPGMDTRAVVARFEAERQALALMDHPNIARVFDGGATPSGRPYFVMELVRGVRITEFCAEARLDPRARLRLFVQVCQAVQHAHQKGIIHRDLKPSNILVTVNDGAPVPKVIDFGIAKATGARLTDKTLFTSFQAFLGTPAYTSPEQAQMSSVDVDTRSDIYSLGVLLYELLTGATPFDGEALLRGGLDELRRVLREQEPLLPSTRLTQESRRVRAGPESLGATPAGDLVRAVRGDLDWIVMKCLEKDRARRYETANGLAADVLRHLAHEPVLARPPSQSYRLRKFIRRNRTLFAAATATLLALLAGAVVSAWQAVRAHRGEQRARTALAELRASAPVYAEQAQRLAAQGQFAPALEKLDYALRLDPGEPDHLRLKANLLQGQLRFAEAVPLYHEVLRLRPNDAAARTNLHLTEQVLRHEATREAAWQDALFALHLAQIREGRSGPERRPLAELVLEQARRRLAPLAAAAGRPVAQLLNPFPGGGLALDLAETPVADLGPARGLPLTRFNAAGSAVTNLAPLRGLPLMSVDLAATAVADLAPLRGAQTLRDLRLDGSAVTSLAPLEGLRLSWLSLHGTAVTDLAPLRGQPLKVLRLGATRVEDLAPLAGLPLEELDCMAIPATDFSPLAGCRALTILDLSQTAVPSLEMLRELRLTSLRLAGTGPLDLAPVAGQPLRFVDLYRSGITEVSPLTQCPTLQSVILPRSAHDAAILRTLPGLTRISWERDITGQPAQDAGEFWAEFAARSAAPR
jgi:serine/threonine protein kinase